jgi:hypothetical protein
VGQKRGCKSEKKGDALHVCAGGHLDLLLAAWFASNALPFGALYSGHWNQKFGFFGRCHHFTKPIILCFDFGTNEKGPSVELGAPSGPCCTAPVSMLLDLLSPDHNIAIDVASLHSQPNLHHIFF